MKKLGDPIWCSWHQGYSRNWPEGSAMCQACVDRCPSCGGTGLIPFHVRLGMATYCPCKYGQEKRAATPVRKEVP